MCGWCGSTCGRNRAGSPIVIRQHIKCNFTQTTFLIESAQESWKTVKLSSGYLDEDNMFLKSSLESLSLVGPAPGLSFPAPLVANTLGISDSLLRGALHETIVSR